MLKLTIAKRDIFGKALKPARLSGQLPVVVYGTKHPAMPFFVATKEFKKTLTQAGESTVISLVGEGENKDVLIHDVSWHPVNGQPLHADFYVVDKTKVIEIKVPLNFIGVSPAVKDLGGTLVKVLHELEIEVLPMNIPREITVDISALATLASQILIKDLALPKEVKVLHPLEAVVAAIGVAKEEPVEEAPVDLAAIEVEKKGKKEEETPAGEEAAPASSPADKAL